MILLELPWLEIALLFALVGACGVSLMREPTRLPLGTQHSQAPRSCARYWPG